MLERVKIKNINTVYKPYLDDHRFLQLYIGGASAGKSVFIAQKIVYHTFTLASFNTMCIRNHNADNHDSTFAEIAKCINKWQLTPYFIINESSGNERIIHRRTGNTIIFKGLDKQAEKRKSTTFQKGILNCIWAEEMSEMLKKEVNQLYIRLRGPESEIKYFLGSMNPIDEDHWIKKAYVDRPIPDDEGFVLRTNYKDNRYLSAEDAKRLEAYKDTDPYYYQVYCLGDWGSIKEGRILKNIEIKDFEINNAVKHFYGGDFGYNDPNTLVDSYVQDQCLYICHEWVKGGLEPEKHKAETRAIPWICGKKNVVCDSSAPEMIAMYNSPGRTFIAYPASKNVYAKGKAYKTSMAMYLKSFKKIYIHATNCPNAAREFPGWSWSYVPKTDKYTDVPEDGEDHTIDAVIYSHEERARRYFATNRK